MLTLNAFALTAHAEANGADDDMSYEITHTQTTVSKDFNDIQSREGVGDGHVQILPEHRHNKKFQTITHISFKVVLPAPIILHAAVLPELPVKTPVLPKAYAYLYFTEINPPPPKA